LCSVPWQLRHRALVSWRERFLKLMILVTSPPPSTCACPGPWHDSQPCPFPSVVLKCGVFLKLCSYTGSWHVLQVSLPTYCAVCLSAFTFCCSCAAENAGQSRNSHRIVRTGPTTCLYHLSNFTFRFLVSHWRSCSCLANTIAGQGGWMRDGPCYLRVLTKSAMALA
jgi:hypothetical protein